MAVALRGEIHPIQGDLQEQVMRVLWQRVRGTVEDVRRDLPPKYRGAYTTVQTILNRLVDRGLLQRQKAGRAFYYSARVSEADYVTRSIDRALSGATRDARRAALASLVGTLDDAEMEEINALAQEITRNRKP